MHIAQHKILISSVIQFDDELEHLCVGLREDLPSISSLQHAVHARVTVLMKTHTLYMKLISVLIYYAQVMRTLTGNMTAAPLHF